VTAAPRSMLGRLDGPLQAWGTHSRFELRDTGRYPTFSGITGVIAAALGYDREQPLGPLADIDVAVRADDPGRMLRDYQTVGVGGWLSASGKVTTGQPKLSERFYLSGAVFAFAVGHPDPGMLEEIEHALRRPHWPVYLGRRCCMPAAPLGIGLSAQHPAAALETLPYQGHRPRTPPTATVVATSGDGTGTTVQDVPVGAFADRVYLTRKVRVHTIALPQPENRHADPYGLSRRSDDADDPYRL